mmetsp:Transcript_19278/g.45031  ORF Transcript_19278/g.45031 Transcript_19278/m.45031 type:complete len:121 (-) Transcript_19278:235-597(-)
MCAPPGSHSPQPARSTRCKLALNSSSSTMAGTASSPSQRAVREVEPNQTAAWHAAGQRAAQLAAHEGTHPHSRERYLVQVKRVREKVVRHREEGPRARLARSIHVRRLSKHEPRLVVPRE